jgi:nicotinamide-nucleotide amidase
VEPGLVHLAVSGPDGTTVHTIEVDGNRHQVRASAVRAAFDLLSAQFGEPDGE